MNKVNKSALPCDLAGVCDGLDLDDLIKMVDKFKQVLEILDPGSSAADVSDVKENDLARVAGILDLITGERLQMILELIQRVDIDKVIRIISIINTLLEKFRGSTTASASPAAAAYEVRRLRANLRAVGGVRELVKMIRELKEVMACLEQADLLPSA